MTNIAMKTVSKYPAATRVKPTNADFIAARQMRDVPDLSPRHDHAGEPAASDTTIGGTAAPSATTPAFLGEGLADLPLTSTLHTIPARRLIVHPKEWSDDVSVICSGWAMSSIALPDGRRQIIAFLLPGDMVSAASLLAPMSGHAVEAVTEVTYRKFKRDDVKGLLFRRVDLLEKLFGIWNEAKQLADQLALDLGRRRADERIARLILRLADKVGARTAERSATFDFPLRQRHIADATGLTPVHVSKVMGEMQRAGLLDINSRSLTIMNRAELQRVAEWR